MPLKLNVGLSRTVNEADFGARGASVNLEIDLEAPQVSQPDQLLGHIRQLFRLARSSVEEQLKGHAAGPVFPSGVFLPAAETFRQRELDDRLQLDDDWDRAWTIVKQFDEADDVTDDSN